MNSRALVLAVLIILLPALLLGPAASAIGGGRSTDGQPAGGVGVIDNEQALRDAIRSGRRVTVIVQLTDAPRATYTGGIRGIGRTKPAKGRKFDPKSPNALGYARYLEQRRAVFKAFLRRATDATVEAEYDTVLNGLAITLSGRNLAQVLRAPGVKTVGIDREFRPLMNISRTLLIGPAPNIDTDIAALSGTPGPGEGMRIGIIDTGIERNHPFFDPSGYSAPAGFPIADNPTNQLLCTSAKIIVARAYPTERFGRTDRCDDTDGHGTHVAGTAAGNAGTTATVLGKPIGGLSGIAHRAFLGNYNVFPNMQPFARSVEIIEAIEDAVEDGMDVLNMSLGGSVMQPERGDPLAQAVNNAAAAGVVVAVASGNEGPSLYTVSSPGNASGALTAAASTNPHFVGIPVTFNTTEVPAALGDFDNFDPPLTAELANWNNTAPGAAAADATRACAPISAGTHPGQIVVIDRGVCTFTTKIRNAESAGAAGVLIVNNVAGDPVAMAHDGTDPFPTIPAAMVGLASRAALRTAAAEAALSATVDGTAPDEFITTPTAVANRPAAAQPNADIIAGFSSRGPVPFDNRFKPDVSAPGVNVLSSTIDPETGAFIWAFFQGTSMATPHVAGSAALLKQLHPSWTPEQIKSALVTRAKREVFDHVAAPAAARDGPISRGGGRVNLDASRNANATFAPSGISFGQIMPSGKGQSVNRAVMVENVTSGALNWSIGTPIVSTCRAVIVVRLPFGLFGLKALYLTGLPVAPPPVTVGAAPLSNGLAAGGTATFNLTATSVPGAPEAICRGDVEVTVNGQLHRLPWIVAHLKKGSFPP